MKLAELTERVGGRLQGDGAIEVEGIAALGEAAKEQISFVNDIRYVSEAAKTKAGSVLVPFDFDAAGCEGKALVFVKDVDRALEELMNFFAPEADTPVVGIHPSACVADSAELGEGVAVGAQVVIGAGVRVGEQSVIGPGCVIGRDVQMGRECTLWPNVVINYGCELGARVVIHANSTIGTDGFGYRQVDGRHCKIPHIGKVVIEDDVEIGANSCVDRAKFGKTVIGRGTKIDNLVMVAHNVRIGEHCILVAQTGIAGSCELGKYVVMGGQSGVADHIKMGDGVMVAAHTGVVRDVAAGEKVIGMPNQPAKEFWRNYSLRKKIPQMAKEIKQLRKQIEKIADTKDHS